MKKQLRIVGIIILLISVGLSGYNSRDNRFFGNWKLTSESLFFVSKPNYNRDF